MRWGSELRALAAAALWAAAAWGANWTDRAEYDLVLTIRAEPSPEKRTQLLDEWAKKYPKSEFRQMRRELYLSAYESTGGKESKMLTVAREMLAEEPGNFVGLYWTAVLAPAVKDGGADTPVQAATAARALLTAAADYFTPAKMPSWMKPEEWSLQRTAVELMARRTLGWASWQQQDYAGAETEFTGYLEKKPADAVVSSWLGMVLSLETEPQKRMTALWHLARAASLRDEGALPDGQRRQIDSLLKSAYISFHGSADGLDPLRETAAAAAFPPAGFALESAEAAAARRAEEELKRTNPELAAWLQLRKRMEAADGETWFAASQAHAVLPRLKGTLIRATPADQATELILGIADSAVEEVLIKLSSSMPNAAEPGTVLAFEGVAESFTRSPFQLTVSADAEKIEGWPAPPIRRK